MSAQNVYARCDDIMEHTNEHIVPDLHRVEVWYAPTHP
jgi:hypothetical protein